MRDGVDIPTWAWGPFAAIVLVLIAIDLVTVRGGRATSRGRAVAWTVIWVALGIGFGVFVGVAWGWEAGQEYLAAYAIEKSLSLDNLFLFLVIFRSLDVPERFQHRVLSWGILGAIVFRGLFVLAGASALERWSWVSWVFAAILLFAAWRAFRDDPTATHDSRLVGWLTRHLPVKADVEHGHFFERDGEHWKVTPLLVALIAVEATDILFAIDSVPAALSMTSDRFLVYTSNLFAILGLRALYLLLAGVLTELAYLHYGLAAVLAFAAVKLVADRWFHLPAWASVAIIVVLVGGSVVASLVGRRRA